MSKEGTEVPVMTEVQDVVRHTRTERNQNHLVTHIVVSNCDHIENARVGKNETIFDCRTVYWLSCVKVIVIMRNAEQVLHDHRTGEALEAGLLTGLQLMFVEAVLEEQRNQVQKFPLHIGTDITKHITRTNVVGVVDIDGVQIHDRTHQLT